MKKLLLASALVAGGSLCMQDVSSAHGGTYRGPGDTVPPGGGGGGGGGGAPGSGGPSTPGPSGPSSPGPASPGGPAGGGGGSGPSTGGGGDAGPDLTIWQYWWGFNKEPYINLKSAIHTGAVVTGSDDFFLGKGEKTQSRDSLRPSEEAIRGKIVPALIEALNSERSNHILSSALIGLAKIGDAKGEDGESKMAAEIKKFINHSNQEVAETAAVSLGILANEAKGNIEILTHLVNDESTKLKDHKIQLLGAVPERTRAFAAYGLGLIGHKASDENRVWIVNTLTDLLDGEGKSMGQRDVPVACLISTGLVPLPFDPSAEPVDYKDREFALPEELTNRQDQLLWVLKYYEDQDNRFMIRAHAPMAMARLLQDVPQDYWLREVVARRLLEDAGEHSDVKQREIQQSVVQALGVIGDCDADPVDQEIREALMNVRKAIADQQARNFALIALAQACGRPGKGTGDPLAGLNPKKKKDSPRAFLLEQLAKGNTGLRPWAGLSLAVLERSLSDEKLDGSPEVRQALRTSLEEAKSPIHVGAYAISCGLVADPDAKEILREKLDRVSDQEARGYCAVGLGLANDRGAIEQIQEIIKKSKYMPDLLKSAAIGLGLLGDKTIVDDLITMLGEATGLSSQASISSALGFIGDARSIDPLIAMLQDKQKTDLARGFAAAALGIVADKEDLPWNTKISVNINYRANTTTLTSPDAGTGILDLL